MVELVGVVVVVVVGVVVVGAGWRRLGVRWWAGVEGEA